MGHLINKEIREGSMLDIRAQPLWLSQSAISMDCFRPPGWDFQHPKGKNIRKWLLTAVPSESKSTVCKQGSLKSRTYWLPSACED